MMAVAFVLREIEVVAQDARHRKLRKLRSCSARHFLDDGFGIGRMSISRVEAQVKRHISIDLLRLEEIHCQPKLWESGWGGHQSPRE
jgi:hypothetical protein